MRTSLLALAAVFVTCPWAVLAWPVDNSTSTSLSPTETTTYGNGTIATVTSITTITTCPASTSCTGQTITFTGTAGPFPCSAHPTCTCVLPGGTQTTSVCPASAKCTGQTTQWTGSEGPTACPARVTCNVVLPSVDTATATKTGPSPTASTTAAAGAGGKVNVADGGLVLAALIAVVGML